MPRWPIWRRVRSLRPQAGRSGWSIGNDSRAFAPDAREWTDTELLATFADTFAKGEVPQEIVNAFRMGRMTALRKPGGSVRGIVVGDYFRRLVSRTLAKQFSQQAQDATALFQYAFKTRAGCECGAHIIQSLTELDPSTTVISVDGVGAFAVFHVVRVA